MGKTYISRSGRKYRVMRRGRLYIVHCQRAAAQGDHGWKPSQSRAFSLHWEEEKAEEELRAYARQKKLEELQ